MDYISMTISCPFCHRTSDVHLPIEGFFAWRAGALVQNAFPKLELEVRETLISGMCVSCQDTIFGEDDEDE